MLGLFPPQQYVFEAIMGVGFGLTLTTILTLVPLVVNSNDLREFANDDLNLRERNQLED